MFCLQKKTNETGNKFLLPNCCRLKLRLDTDSHLGLSGGERLASNLERDCVPAAKPQTNYLFKTRKMYSSHLFPNMIKHTSFF